MKKLFACILTLCTLLSMVACANTDEQKQSDSPSEIAQASSAPSSQPHPTDPANEEQPTSPAASQPQGRDEYIIIAFYAEEGAVIYDQNFNDYGYPEVCYFHKKCEKCGFVSNNNGSARGNLTTSYHCTKCGNNQHVEISTDRDWVTVYD